MSHNFQIHALEAPSLFAAISGFAEAHIRSADAAAPGDFLGLVLEVSSLTDKHIGYYHSYPVRRFIVMGEEGPEIVRFENLPDAQRDIAARLAMEASVADWSGDEKVRQAVEALEDEENGLEGSLYLLPWAGLLLRDNYEDYLYLELDPAEPEQVAEMLEQNFHLLRRPAASNHEAIERQGLEARDIVVLNALIALTADDDEAPDAPILLAI